MELGEETETSIELLRTEDYSRTNGSDRDEGFCSQLLECVRQRFVQFRLLTLTLFIAPGIAFQTKLVLPEDA